MTLFVAYGRLCAATFFVSWLFSVLLQSCRGEDDNKIDDDSNKTGNATGFEVLPGLYGVLGATGLIFSVVITLICCTMILAHGKIVPHKAKLTLLKLREQEEEETDWAPEYRQRDTPILPHRILTPLTSLDSNALSQDPSNYPDNGGLYLTSRQTTV